MGCNTSILDFSSLGEVELKNLSLDQSHGKKYNKDNIFWTNFISILSNLKLAKNTNRGDTIIHAHKIYNFYVDTNNQKIMNDTHTFYLISENDYFQHQIDQKKELPDKLNLHDIHPKDIYIGNLEDEYFEKILSIKDINLNGYLFFIVYAIFRYQNEDTYLEDYLIKDISIEINLKLLELINYYQLKSYLKLIDNLNQKPYNYEQFINLINQSAVYNYNIHTAIDKFIAKYYLGIDYCDLHEKLALINQSSQYQYLKKKIKEKICENRDIEIDQFLVCEEKIGIKFTQEEKIKYLMNKFTFTDFCKWKIFGFSPNDVILLYLKKYAKELDYISIQICKNIYVYLEKNPDRINLEKLYTSLDYQDFSCINLTQIYYKTRGKFILPGCQILKIPNKINNQIVQIPNPGSDFNPLPLINLLTDKLISFNINFENRYPPQIDSEVKYISQNGILGIITEINKIKITVNNILNYSKSIVNFTFNYIVSLNVLVSNDKKYHAGDVIYISFNKLKKLT